VGGERDRLRHRRVAGSTGLLIAELVGVAAIFVVVEEAS
jgi:hypothetical protein